jgi:hypothetical protein
MTSSCHHGPVPPGGVVITSAGVPALVGVSVARVSQIESGDVSTQNVLSRFVAALGSTLKLIADFGDEQLKLA